MDQIIPVADQYRPAPCAPPARRPALALVDTRLELAVPAEPAPPGWDEAVRRLLAWLGVAADIAAPARTRRLPRVTGWAGASASLPAAPLFAPWLGWSPAALQHGGLPGLPQALFAASYGIDHARAAPPGQGGVDIMLMSPHPAQCLAEEAGAVPVPRLAVMRAMIAAALAEGRERIAIILTARQRNAVARQLLAAGSRQARAGAALEILTIEDALAPLMAGARGWDAIIAMPDLRGTVFTLLAETSGVRGAWPMLWRGRGGALAVTAEARGEAVSRLALDAPALIHALALTLHEAGMAAAARRLHEGWARLRDSGVTTAAQAADAPYAKALADADFLAMLCAEKAVSKRPQQPWRALGVALSATRGSQSPALRIVPSVQSPL